MSKKFYITTAIDYVNNLPHLGTAYEKIGADVLARFLRMEGHEVHFQMGNDEHAANVKKEADRRGVPPKKYCDEMRGTFEGIWKQLGISYDGFIQTSEPRHHAAVKKFIGMLKKGDVYEAPYEGWYCESCEAFYTEKDLLDGKCPAHKSQPKWLHEKNYFFRLSGYQKKLLDHYKKHPDFILPEIRKNEIVSLVRSGLQDISISRSSFSWGVPFPEDPSHVVYVWFDALINYLTAIGYPSDKKSFKKWWPASLHVIGKDITRFHCVIWPAMLMSAGLPLPKTVFGHGFIFLKGEKMSKTLGNIVSPLDIVSKYGPDALRYYLLRESSFGSDGDFTWENFIKRYNSDLANDLGNLLNRTLGMANKYLDGKIAKPAKRYSIDPTLKKKVEQALKTVRKAVNWEKSGDIDFHQALGGIWEVVGAADKFIDTSAPWKIAKEGKTEEINRILYRVVDTIKNIALLVAPFLPLSSREIWSQLGLERQLAWDEQKFSQVTCGTTPSTLVTAGRPIFPRIESLEGQAASKEVTMEIDITEFQKIDLRIAEIKQAEKVEGADRLLKLQVDIGGEPRQIVAGIAQHYAPEALIGKKVIVVANLKPATIRGVESRGMLLAAGDGGVLSIVIPERDQLPSGARVK